MVGRMGKLHLPESMDIKADIPRNVRKARNYIIPYANHLREDGYMNVEAGFPARLTLAGFEVMSVNPFSLQIHQNRFW